MGSKRRRWSSGVLDTGLRRCDGDGIVIAAKAAIQGADALDAGLHRSRPELVLLQCFEQALERPALDSARCFQHAGSAIHQHPAHDFWQLVDRRQTGQLSWLQTWRGLHLDSEQLAAYFPR